MRVSDCHNIDDFRRLAKRRLPWPVFDYIDGAAEDERMMAANRAGFADLTFCPRVLTGVGEPDRKADRRVAGHVEGHREALHRREAARHFAQRRHVFARRRGKRLRGDEQRIDRVEHRRRANLELVPALHDALEVHRAERAADLEKTVGE